MQKNSLDHLPEQSATEKEVKFIQVALGPARRGNKKLIEADWLDAPKQPPAASRPGVSRVQSTEVAAWVPQHECRKQSPKRGASLRCMCLSWPYQLR
eukprot:1160585-Pelagomonas_calceolata.AAC.8